MVVERTASFGKLHLKGIVASVGLTAGLLVLIFPLPELESPARIQLALTLGALSFWASGVMPAPITGMLYMGLLLITNSSDPLTVFSGWTNEGGGLWLVLCAFLIASGVERSGLARRAALSICASGQVKGFQSLIAAIAVIELLFALIIPSAFARTFVILAVAKEVCKVSIAASSGGDSAMRQCANPLAIGARLRRQSGWESFCSQPFFELSVARLPRSSR